MRYLQNRSILNFILFMLLILGPMAASVGSYSEGGTIGWELIFLGAGIMAVPFYFGWNAAKEDQKDYGKKLDS